MAEGEKMVEGEKTMKTQGHFQSKGGLEGVVAARTRLSLVDGRGGRLWIGGCPVESLAPHARVEDVIFLLWYDRWPSEAERDALRDALAARRHLPAGVMELLEAASRAQVPIMDALMMGSASLALTTHASTREADEEKATGKDSGLAAPAGIPDRLFDQALTLVAAFPLIVGTYARLLEGRAPLPFPREGGQAEVYLKVLLGPEVDQARVRALSTYLNTVVDHGLNASTFTARVIISTRSDLVAAVTGALGALKGPLHGGAPGPALELVREIGTRERIEPILRAKLERGERLMGFGHRVYKVRDPRADVLDRAVRLLWTTGGENATHALAREVEKTALALLKEYKPGRNLQTNVEYYTALLLDGIGLNEALFTPTFAVSRVVGWIAHAFEEHREGRLIRPSSEYIGVKDRAVPQPA